MNDNIFFILSKNFISWMIKKHKECYTFSLCDDRFPHYDFNISVSINDLRYKAQLQKLKENEND